MVVFKKQAKKIDCVDLIDEVIRINEQLRDELPSNLLNTKSRRRLSTVNGIMVSLREEVAKKHPAKVNLAGIMGPSS